MADDQGPNPYVQEYVQTPTMPFKPTDTSTPPQLSFEPDPAPVVKLPDSVASDRAAKAYDGLKGVIPADYDDYRYKFLNGLETQQRDIDASKVDALNEQRRFDATTALANRLGRPLTQDDLDQLDSQLFKDDLYNGKVDPRSIYEEKYAHAWLSRINWPTTKEDNHWLTQAQAEIPNEVADTEREASDIIKRNEYIDTRLQNVQAKLQERSAVGTVGSFAASTVPFLTTYMLRGNVPYSGFDFTTSGALEDQRRELLRLPFNGTGGFKDKFDSIMDNLEGYNLDYAAQFASAMQGQSTQEKIQHALGDVIDITSIPAIGVGKAIIKRAVLYNNVRRAYSAMARDAVRPPAPSPLGLPEWTTPRVVEVRATNAAGNLEASATSQEAINVVNRIAGRDNPEQEALAGIQTVFNGQREAVGAGPGRYGQEIVNRIQESYGTMTQSFLDIMNNIMRVERIPAVLASRRAVQQVLDGIKDEYRNLGNTILNQSDIYWDSVRNTYYSDLILGRADGTVFRDESAADVFARYHRIEGYTTMPQGSGVVIRLPKPVKENTAWLREALLTRDTTIPDSLMQPYMSWLGWARTPDETLAAQNVWNRKTAVYAQSVLQDLYKRNAQHLVELQEGRVLKGNKFSFQRRAQFRQWQQMVDAQRLERDAQGLPGRFFDHPAEIESYYWRNFNHAPSQLEIEAYFDFKRTVAMDWALRNIEVYKYMSRLGVEEWQFSAFAPVRGGSTKTPWLRGVKQITMPPEDAIVLRMGRNVGDEKVYRGRMSARDRAEIKQNIENGTEQMIRLAEPQNMPMQSWGGRIRVNDRIEYIVTNKAGNRPLSFQVLPMRGGGHVEYDYKHYIKQARIIPQYTGRAGGRHTFQHWYDGDITVMPVQLRALGEDGARVLNEAREHLRRGDLPAAEAALRPLPIDFNDFRSWFRATRNPLTGGRSAPRLSLTQPFYVVPADRTIADVHPIENQFRDAVTGRSTFRDGSREGNLMRQFSVPFTQERDAWELMGLHDDGSRYRPLYRVEPAHMINPLVTMNRGMNRIINSFFMDDYKLQSVEHWLQQAAPHMRVDGDLNAMRQAPFYYFHRADNFWRRDSGRVAQGQIEKLRVAAKEIKLFMGEPSWFDTMYQGWMTKLTDDIYGARNPITRLGLQATHWGMSTIPKAGDFIRAAVFHSTMGMFNWVQALVQNMTYVNIFGIAGPRHALSGVLGATLHQFSRLAGVAHFDVIDALDSIASKMFFRPGEFKEANEAFHRTGFGNVGGEHIMQNFNYEPSLTRSTVGKFLNAGEVFFKGGERHMRFGAWYTAYKEFRAKQPTGALTNENLREILNRADLLAGNMSTASRSALQRGVLNWSTQFMGYQMRLSELMTGKRLTPYVKARLFLANALVYGIPVAGGLYAAPINEIVRHYAIANNYVVGENWYTDVMMQGLPSYIGAMISGSGDPQEGTQMNIGERYGSPGVDFLRDALYGDKTVRDLIIGAPGQSIEEAYTNTSGFLKVIWSFAHDGGESFPYTHDMVLDAARQIASVNKFVQGMTALNEGVWRNKRGLVVEPVSPSGAVIRTLTGLNSQDASDIIRKNYNFEADQEAQKIATKFFVQEFVRGVKAINDNNPTDADAHFARGKAFLDAANYPRTLIGRAITEGVNAATHDLISRTNWNYYLRNMPAGAEQGRIEAFEAAQQLRNKRGQ